MLLAAAAGERGVEEDAGAAAPAPRGELLSAGSEVVEGWLVFVELRVMGKMKGSCARRRGRSWLLLP